MKPLLKIGLITCLLISSSFSEEIDYSRKGMLVEDSQVDAVNEPSSKRMKPKIREEERSYGEIIIKDPNEKNVEVFDIDNFIKAYKKNNKPKLIFFVDHRFNDAVGVHGTTKNYMEETDMINKHDKDMMSDNRRNKAQERRWEVQDAITNSFLDAGVKLVDRKVIVRIAEGLKYKEGVPTQNNNKIIVTDTQIKSIKTGPNLTISMLNNIIEMDALNKYVDYIIEVKISDYSYYKYPTLRAKILNLKTGAYLGSVMQKHKSSKKMSKEYVTTSSGYALKRDTKVKLDKYSVEFSHKLMKKLTNSFK